MKRLGLYLFVGVIIIGAFGGFISPNKIYAQQSVTRENALKNGLVLFESASGNLVRESTSIDQKYPDKNSQEFKDEKAINDAEKAALRKSTKAFEETMASGVGKPVPQAYEDALTAAINSLSSDKNSTQALKEPVADRFIQALINELNAEKTNKERLSSISSGKAISENAQNLSNSTAQAANPTGAERLNPSACNMFTGGNLLSCMDQLIAKFIRVTLLEIAGFLLWFSSNIFNMSIQLGVLHFDKFAPNELYKVFVVVRQVISLVILFTGLYLVGLYIIGREDKITRFLPWLALFALFVNFSYPMTRALVDVSNVISLNVYASVVGPNAIEGSGDATAGGIIINRLGLGQLAAGAADVRKANTADFVGRIDSTPGALMAVAYILYAAFIFFMSAAIFIFRTMALVFLTVVSPLLFVDSVVPMLGEHAVKLRKIFVEQLLVAPLFMVMLALTLKFLQVFQTVDSERGLTGPLKELGRSSLSTGNTGSITLFFNILMMLIMLHIMYTVTKKVSGAVGQSATNFMGKVGGFGMGLASGGTGILARASLGRVAAAARDSNWITDNKNSVIGRSAFRMTNALAQGTYDVRNSKLVAGGMAKAGMGMGAGTTKNYEQAKEEKDKQKVADYENVGTYRANVYAPDGTLLHRKGERDASRSGAREKFMKDAGGMFGSGADAQQKMKDSDKAYVSKAKSEYATLKGEEKKSYYNKQDTATQAALKADADKTNMRLVDEYETLSPEKQKTFLARQDEDTRAAMQEIMRTPKEQRGQASAGIGTASEASSGKINYDLPPGMRGYVSPRGVEQKSNDENTASESAEGKVDYDIPPTQRGFVSPRGVEQKIKEELAKKEAQKERSPEEKAMSAAKAILAGGRKLQPETGARIKGFEDAEKEIKMEERRNKDHDLAIAENKLRSTDAYKSMEARGGKSVGQILAENLRASRLSGKSSFAATPTRARIETSGKGSDPAKTTQAETETV